MARLSNICSYPSNILSTNVSKYSPRVSTGRVLAAQSFDGKFLSASLSITVTCAYGDPEGSDLSGVDSLIFVIRC